MMITAESIVRESIAALNRGDIDTALSYCADNVLVWAPGRFLEGQEVHGKDQLRLLLEQSEMQWPDIWTSIQTLVSDGVQVAVELIAVGSENGQNLSQPMSAFYRVENGLIVEQRSYYDLGALARTMNV